MSVRAASSSSLAGRRLSSLTPVNADAAAWRTRVEENGGSVSIDTFLAVNTFCTSIAVAGIRSAFLRLNLFCGNNLAACLVPLYRGQSLGGTQLGNTTDTNSNFVSGDYSERGSSGGLKGDGTTKLLATGLAPSSFASLNSCHASASGTSIETSSDRMIMGSYSTANFSTIFLLDAWSAGNGGRGFRVGVSGNVFTNTSATSEPHLLGVRASSASATLYRSGTAATTNTAASTISAGTGQICVFGITENSSTIPTTASRLTAYSVGNGMNATQALAFSNAIIAFNTALGRV